MNRWKTQVFRVCPKSGKIVGVRKPKGLMRVRVVPKPSRAAYPCQQVAMPLASGFVLWLAGMTTASLAFRSAQGRLRQARYVSGGLALLIALVGVGWGTLTWQSASDAQALAQTEAYTPHPVNQPLGVAKGYKPGRVAWVHDPQVTDWNGTATVVGESWFNHINQTEATNMMQWGLTGYADATTTSAAWNAIFQNFNGGAAYQPGEKIFIKVNL